ncbi:hypothetical protein [Martelella mediterranea]|uniref:SH3 domain-containing protein n=1 Tax=Martelella mediterranea TaxID=293089 RepID=A0A4R3NU55_9HYPH|nr:hypothetical protein [Martelella mediterranea]TCT40949.1 hypothetical protein EDC90_100889 [Martelella mediterranea]
MSGILRKCTMLSAAALLTLAAPASTGAYSGEVYTVCHLDPHGDNYLSLRSCGSSKCNEITRLGPGTFVLTLEPAATKGWREVMVMRSLAEMDNPTGPMGWVYGKYICYVDLTEG